MIRRLLDGLYLAAGIAAAGFLIGIFGIMMLLTLGRPFGFNVPAGDDLVAWCLVAVSFLGLAHTFRRGEMIRVGLLLERLSGRARHGFEIASLLVATVFVLYFAWYAVQLTYDSWRFNDMAQGVLAIPLWIPQLGFSAGLIILAIALIDEVEHVLRGNRPRYEKDAPATPEELIRRLTEGGGG